MLVHRLLALLALLVAVRAVNSRYLYYANHLLDHVTECRIADGTAPGYNSLVRRGLEMFQTRHFRESKACYKAALGSYWKSYSFSDSKRLQQAAKVEQERNAMALKKGLRAMTRNPSAWQRRNATNFDVHLKDGAAGAAGNAAGSLPPRVEDMTVEQRMKAQQAAAAAVAAAASVPGEKKGAAPAPRAAFSAPEGLPQPDVREEEGGKPGKGGEARGGRGSGSDSSSGDSGSGSGSGSGKQTMAVPVLRDIDSDVEQTKKAAESIYKGEVTTEKLKKMSPVDQMRALTKLSLLHNKKAQADWERERQQWVQQMQANSIRLRGGDTTQRSAAAADGAAPPLPP